MLNLLYIAVVIGILLPLVFRKKYWLRILCVLILGFIASLHFTFLMVEHRLLAERGLQHYGVTSGSQLPEDFKTGEKIIQELSQGQMPLVGLLFVAFGILAILPFRGSETKMDKQ